MRPLISYDDITPSEPTNNPPALHPPVKKRRTTQNQRQGRGGGRQHTAHPVQHWDDPGNQAPHMLYNNVAPSAASTTNGTVSATPDQEYNEEENEEESRELTHEEIWDDSALIEAWNSANVEYETFHGPGKNWKEESVKKSPLWYNIPPTKPESAPLASTNSGFQEGGKVEDSTPLNFDTFVPTHDPSLAATLANSGSSVPFAVGDVSGIDRGAATAMVSQDEAVSNAMAAMYWSGYWTAVYHCRKNEATAEGKADEAEQQEDGDENVEDEEMLPAQR